MLDMLEWRVVHVGFTCWTCWNDVLDILELPNMPGGMGCAGWCEKVTQRIQLNASDNCLHHQKLFRSCESNVSKTSTALPSHLPP